MKSGLKVRNIFLLLAALFLGIPWVSASLARDKQTPEKSRDNSKYQAWLQKEVRHELLLLPYYTVFDNLAYQIDGDKVVLSGQVVNATLKSDAESVVRKIEGVSAVVNNIEVLPLSPNDDRLRRAIFRAIYRSTVLERYALGAVPPIHIMVKGGQVTLEGVVDNEADKNLANIQANSVPGAFSVTNNLRVVKT